MRTTLTIMLCLAALSYADSATQTDWSGGPGQTSPVTEWGAGFDSTTDASWLAIEGQVCLTGELLGTAVEHVVTSNVGGTTGQLGVGDINGDGVTDICVVSNTADKICWFEQSDSQWTEHVVDNSIDMPLSCFLADVDNDNDIDIIVGTQLTSSLKKVVWFENLNGLGTS